MRYQMFLLNSQSVTTNKISFVDSQCLQQSARAACRHVINLVEMFSLPLIAQPICGLFSVRQFVVNVKRDTDLSS